MKIKKYKNFLIKEDLEDGLLKKTCEEYLAYLLDQGFKVNVGPMNDKIDIDILSDKENVLVEDDWYENGEGINWCDVKDDIIPLITLFIQGKLDFKLEAIEFYFIDAYSTKYDMSKQSGRFNIVNLISENDIYDSYSLDNMGLCCITIRVSKK